MRDRLADLGVAVRRLDRGVAAKGRNQHLGAFGHSSSTIYCLLLWMEASTLGTMLPSDATYLHHRVYSTVELIALVEAEAFEESRLGLTLSQGRPRWYHRLSRKEKRAMEVQRCGGGEPMSMKQVQCAWQGMGAR